jgi:hypothetical protein
MNKTLQNDIARALRTGRYECTDDGRLLVNAASIFVGGSFISDVNGKDPRLLPNLFTDEGLTDVLKVYFQQGSQPTAFYLAPFSGTGVPDRTLTAANFNTRQTEFTAYDEATRVGWTAPAAAITTPSIGNAAAVATFTNNLDDATVWGFALMTNQVKSATTGKAVSCFKDTTPRDHLRVGDKLNLQYVITATDAG